MTACSSNDSRWTATADARPSPPAAASDAPAVIAVVGPTAVGKTALAEAIAARVGGEIVSADSMQVYRGLDIGTAKPPPEARRVPHHCIDIVDLDVPYSAALYQRDARAAIDDIRHRGLVPVIAGGTGLYVRAALDDMRFPAGDRDSQVRRRLERLLEREGASALHERLAEADPLAAALIHPNNTPRVIRALEMLQTEGRSYADQVAGFRHPRPFYPCRYLGLTCDRAVLYERIDARVDAMMAAGLLGEVRDLVEAGHADDIRRIGAIGYKELLDVVAGRRALDEAVAEIKQASRRYAKRQLTWLRADERVVWLDVTGLTGAEPVERALALLESTETHEERPRSVAGGMDLEFVKMQGCGNDFVVVDDPQGSWELDPDAVGFLCDRHFGIGADGVILVRPATEPGAEYLMHYINADGSLAEMCGNGIRVFAKFLMDRGRLDGTDLTVQTLGGLRAIRVQTDDCGGFLAARVDMGAPILEAARIPTTLPGDPVIDATVVTSAGEVEVTCVSMGNPHAILWVDDVDTAGVETIGPEIETDPAFPARTNVEFAQLMEPDEDGDRIRVRVWERGVGETLACGTGACATAVAGALTGRTGRRVTIELPGGDLLVEWSDAGPVFMTGPAAEVYSGVLSIPAEDDGDEQSC